MERPSALYWIVAVLACLMAVGSVFDMIMLLTGGEAYKEQYGSEMVNWVRNFPLWRKALWALAIFSAMVGAVGFILRREWTPLMYLISVIAMVFPFLVYDLALAGGAKIYGTGGLIASVILILINVFFWWYARRQYEYEVI